MIGFCPRYHALSFLVLGLVLAFVFPPDVRGDDERPGGREVTVRCDKGETISDALAHHKGALTIKVVGTCDEHVTVNRNDVGLIAAAPDAGIHGPDLNTDTVRVTADRFVLDGLAISGGRNGIAVAGGSRATIVNCTVRANGSGIVGGIGIFLSQGANGTVDNCESTGNGADGLALDASIATITNSTFSSNARTGILVFNGSTARIGMTNQFAAAPNTVSDNGSSGIHITIGSTAVLVGNAISGNGTNPAGAFGRFGVSVFLSRADLPGGNTITGSFGPGVLVGASTVLIGDPGFGFPTSNVIRGNATAAPSQGINVTANSTLFLRNATVENNNGTGVALGGRSVLTVFSGTVTGHTNTGVQLSQGSAAIFQPVLPLPNLSGNTGFDLKCLDGESSYAGPIAPGATIDCTGF